MQIVNCQKMEVKAYKKGDDIVIALLVINKRKGIRIEMEKDAFENFLLEATGNKYNLEIKDEK